MVLFSTYVPDYRTRRRFFGSVDVITADASRDFNDRGVYRLPANERGVGYCQWMYEAPKTNPFYVRDRNDACAVGFRFRGLYERTP